MRRAWLVVCALVATSCGAGDVRGPRTPPPFGPCATGEQVAPSLFELLRGSTLAPIARLVQEELVDGGPRKVSRTADLVRLLAGAAERLPLERDGALQPLAAFSPTVRALIDTSLGDASLCTATPSAECPRFSGMVQLGHVVQVCGGAPPVPTSGRCGNGSALLHGGAALVRWALTAQEPGASSPLRALTRLLGDAHFRELLDAIDVESRVGRQGTSLLVHKIAEAIADPAFDFDEIDNLLRRFIYPIVDSRYPELRRPIEEAAALGRSLLSEGTCLHETLGPVAACWLQQEPDAAAPQALGGLVYDFVVETDVSVASLTSQLADLVEGPDGAALAGALVELVDWLGTAEGPRAVVLTFLGALLSDARAREAGPALYALLDERVLGDLERLLGRVRTGCEIAPASP